MLDSSDKAVARVVRYYELVDDGDIPGLLDLFTPDAVYERPGYPAMTGREELDSFFSDKRVIAGGKHTLRETVAGEDVVAAHGDFTGTLRDGREVSVRFADFFTVGEDGRFSRRDTYFFSPLV
ncbi:nuclear transport factor 2 family protein [Saccharothrix longispora]|uniref:nuclear transport factor 2 family protein n=1 Tax=Saccharothrix longispora TaxID=33920 RepID=UPI0028FD0A48|nr:nuclear transport factor 2 family protein [Saccharothrix longispora]MDU0293751.1 nuclear transport factor 2 family protein [Saccharothrix longispora]